MSAKTYSKVGNIWSVLGLSDVESMAVIRFSTWAQTFLAPVLRCQETSVWREVRFLLNALTFLAQVAEMENRYLRDCCFSFNALFSYRFRSLYH